LPNDKPVTLAVYDLTGKQVAVLLDGEVKPIGLHQVIFDSTEYPSGTYIYTIKAGEYTATDKMNIVK